MQDHTSAVLQRDELTYREALGTRFADALRPEIADSAKAYDPAWLDRDRIRVIVNGVRVRVPATLHTAHLPGPGASMIAATPATRVAGYQGVQ
jgi:hypothetical protein